jgi:hypothetical protein
MPAQVGWGAVVEVVRRRCRSRIATKDRQHEEQSGAGHGSAVDHADVAELTALALLYSGTDPSTLLALADRGRETLSLLLEAMVPELPPRVYAHLSPGLVRVLERRYASQAHCTHVKMALVDAMRVAGIDTAGVLCLVRDAEAAPDVNEYDQRLREVIAPVSPLPGELEDLALTSDEICRKGGAKVAPEAALAPHPRRHAPASRETGWASRHRERSEEVTAMPRLLKVDGVSASTLRNRRREV